MYPPCHDRPLGADIQCWSWIKQAGLLCTAGREAAGKAFRLYTEAAYLGLEDASVPEIQRVMQSQSESTVCNATHGFQPAQPRNTCQSKEHPVAFFEAGHC